MIIFLMFYPKLAVEIRSHIQSSAQRCCTNIGGKSKIDFEKCFESWFWHIKLFFTIRRYTILLLEPNLNNFFKFLSQKLKRRDPSFVCKGLFYNQSWRKDWRKFTRQNHQAKLNLVKIIQKVTKFGKNLLNVRNYTWNRNWFTFRLSLSYTLAKVARKFCMNFYVT